MKMVWFMLILATPSNPHLDGGDMYVYKNIYDTHQECVDSIDRVVSSLKPEPVIDQVGVVCVEGVIKPLKQGSL